MSLPTNTDLDCPHCGGANQTAVWSSVNAKADPHLRAKLFENDLNVLRCRLCGGETEIASDLLYHDMDRHFQVWLRYREDSGMIHLDGNALRLATAVIPNYRYRIVRSRSELCEKVRIFEGGLDDRVIELCKLVVWRQIQRDPTAAPPWSFLFLERSRPILRRERLVFIRLDNGGDTFEYDLASTYGVTKTQLEAIGSPLMSNEPKWRIIGSEYAKLLAGGS